MLGFILALTAAGPGPAPIAPAQAPRVADGALWLNLGQTAVITLTPSGPALAADTLVEKDNHFTGDGVRFTFKKLGEMAALDIKNGYDRTLTYSAEIYLADGRHAHTSICPAPANITGFETWGDPIVRIRLDGFKLADKPGLPTSLECR